MSVQETNPTRAPCGGRQARLGLLRWNSVLLAFAVVLLPALCLAADDGGHGESKVIVPQTVWAIISFAVVLFILWKKLLPPILDGMDRRALEIREALTAAEKAKADAEAVMQRHQDDLEAARKEAQLIIDEGKADAEKLRQQIVKDAERDAETIKDRAVKDIELAKQSALDDLHKQSVDISFDLAGQLIHKNLDREEHKGLVEERLRAIQAGGS